MLGPYTHRIDPVLLDLGGVHLWWYGLGFALGFLELHLFLRRGGGLLRLSPREVWSLSLYMTVDVLAGGRALEIAFDEWPFYRGHLHLLPAWWLGGMATHGLLLGGAVGAALFARRYGRPFLLVADALVIPAAFLMGMGRIGNFIDGRIFRVNVYAFSLYVDANVARAALSEFAGATTEALARDGRFTLRLLDLDFGMALRLVMTRTVSGGDVADAFDEALRPRMPRAGRGPDGDDAAAGLAQLRGYLDVDECDAMPRLSSRAGPPVASPWPSTVPSGRPSGRARSAVPCSTSTWARIPSSPPVDGTSWRGSRACCSLSAADWASRASAPLAGATGCGLHQPAAGGRPACLRPRVGQ